MGKVVVALLLNAFLFVRTPFLRCTWSWIPDLRRNHGRRIVEGMVNSDRGTGLVRFGTDDGTLEEPLNPLAYPQQTPHSGRHFWPSHPAWKRPWRRSRRRFTEGWYYRLTIPEEEVSFAFIISVEDPGQNSPLTLVCLQVIGPDDEYLVQGDRRDTGFWAWKNQQGLGHVFSYREGVSQELMHAKTSLTHTVWNETVESGFQVLPTSLWGRLRGRDGTKGEILDMDGEIVACDFDFVVDPICGWGGTIASEQKSTAGWLSSFPIFEPH